jgi:hypothetical protein
VIRFGKYGNPRKYGLSCAHKLLFLYSWLVIGVTRQMSLVDQHLRTIPEHMSSPPVLMDISGTIWKIWKKSKLKNEKLWKIQKRGKLKSEMIRKIRRKVGGIVK